MLGLAHYRYCETVRSGKKLSVSVWPVIIFAMANFPSGNGRKRGRHYTGCLFYWLSFDQKPTHAVLVKLSCDRPCCGLFCLTKPHSVSRLHYMSRRKSLSVESTLTRDEGRSNAVGCPVVSYNISGMLPVCVLFI